MLVFSFGDGVGLIFLLLGNCWRFHHRQGFDTGHCIVVQWSSISSPRHCHQRVNNYWWVWKSFSLRRRCLIYTMSIFFFPYLFCKILFNIIDSKLEVDISSVTLNETDEILLLEGASISSKVSLGITLLPSPFAFLVRFNSSLNREHIDCGFAESRFLYCCHLRSELLFCTFLLLHCLWSPKSLFYQFILNDIIHSGDSHKWHEALSPRFRPFESIHDPSSPWQLSFASSSSLYSTFFSSECLCCYTHLILSHLRQLLSYSFSACVLCLLFTVAPTWYFLTTP